MAYRESVTERKSRPVTRSTSQYKAFVNQEAACPPALLGRIRASVRYPNRTEIVFYFFWYEYSTRMTGRHLRTPGTLVRYSYPILVQYRMTVSGMFADHVYEYEYSYSYSRSSIVLYSSTVRSVRDRYEYEYSYSTSNPSTHFNPHHHPTVE